MVAAMRCFPQPAVGRRQKMTRVGMELRADFAFIIGRCQKKTIIKDDYRKTAIFKDSY